MNSDKGSILLYMVEGIPPIEKKQSHSFDDEHNTYNNNPLRNENHNILADLLDMGEGQAVQIKQNTSKSFFAGEEVKYNPFIVAQPNDSIENGNRFDSFSMARTENNNSTLFLNASKNFIQINSFTSTRNKVAFFKNSLVIVRDN